MSKAEERANERYNITRGDDTEETSGIDMQRVLDFIDGYHQAEQDNELTWEDMRLIDTISSKLLVSISNTDDKKFYKEVLKRFKNMKK